MGAKPEPVSLTAVYDFDDPSWSPIYDFTTDPVPSSEDIRRSIYYDELGAPVDPRFNRASPTSATT